MCLFQLIDPILANSKPLRARNWEVQLHFKVSGHGKDLSGDGMAFWYVKDSLRPGMC